MNIKLKHAWVTNSPTDNSDAVMDVEGVGEVKIAVPLPEELKAQIEDFYRGLLKNRFDRASGFRPQPTRGSAPQNPATLREKGEEV